MFPQESVACQLRVKVFEQLLPEVLSLELGVTVPSQLSDAVGAVKLGVKLAGQPSTVVLAPGEPIVGLVVSLTVMVWLWLLELPHTSVA